jgi:hypothetical protein
LTRNPSRRDDPQEETTAIDIYAGPDTISPVIDPAALAAHINRLEIIASATRRAYRELLFAALASLAAADAGQRDPLRFLREHLRDPPPPSVAIPGGGGR